MKLYVEKCTYLPLYGLCCCSKAYSKNVLVLFLILRSLIWIKYLDLIFAYSMKQRLNFTFFSC